MSHSHDDRVADRSSDLCAAYGCPLLGTMSASTTGASEWWCVCHFAKDVGQYQAITSELRRLEWLANAVTDIRTRQHNANWRATFERIKTDIQLAQRNDLQWGNEGTEAWMIRLEDELAKLVRSATRPPQRQRPIVTEQPADTFSRVGFDLPEAA